MTIHCKKYLLPVFNFRENSRTVPIKLSNKLRSSPFLIHTQQLVNEAAVCIQLRLCTLTVRLELQSWWKTLLNVYRCHTYPDLCLAREKIPSYKCYTTFLQGY